MKFSSPITKAEAIMLALDEVAKQVADGILNASVIPYIPRKESSPLYSVSAEYDKAAMKITLKVRNNEGRVVHQVDIPEPYIFFPKVKEVLDLTVNKLGEEWVQNNLEPYQSGISLLFFGVSSKLQLYDTLKHQVLRGYRKSAYSQFLVTLVLNLRKDVQ